MQEYIESKKELQQGILEFLDSDEDNQLQLFANLEQIFDEQEIKEDQNELSALLHLISSISNNYRRSPNFFSRIEQIITFFESNIKQTYSNFEIFNIFKRNKRILLLLLKKKLLVIDDYIAKTLQKEKYKMANYISYLYPEMESFLPVDTKAKIEDEIRKITDNDMDKFETLRDLGENHYTISKLIRDDSIEDFITYINHENIPLSSTLKDSLFETNDFLIQKSDISLIEYASFFGSIQIVRYLYTNGVDLNVDLWYSSIHSGNPDLIHFLEEENMSFDPTSFSLSFTESVKCHQINITNYLLTIYVPNQPEKYTTAFIYGLPYYNYSFFPDNFDENLAYDFLLRYDHCSIVEFLLNSNESKFKINTKII